VFALTAFSLHASASYLPGLVPKDYNLGQKLKIF
jgi:hypothetical protein